MLLQWVIRWCARWRRSPPLCHVFRHKTAAGLRQGCDLTTLDQPGRQKRSDEMLRCILLRGVSLAANSRLMMSPDCS